MHAPQINNWNEVNKNFFFFFYKQKEQIIWQYNIETYMAFKNAIGWRWAFEWFNIFFPLLSDKSHPGEREDSEPEVSILKYIIVKSDTRLEVH